MKKERWDNRMSLWTRLIYGIPKNEAAKQMKQVAQEDIEITKRLSNNNTFLEQLDKTVKEGEEHNFEII